MASLNRFSLVLFVAAVFTTGVLTTEAIADNSAIGQMQEPTDSAKSYEGQVSQVTPNSFVITTRYGNRTISVNTSPDTTYGRFTRLTERDLQIGDTLEITGERDNLTKTIVIRTAILLNNANSAPTRGKGREDYLATVSSVAPKVQVELADGSLYTLTIRERSVMFSRGPGDASDIALANNVRVTGTSTGGLDNETLNASHVELMTTDRGAHVRRARRQRKPLVTIPVQPAIDRTVN